jgi:hypothetical protein
LHRARVHTNLLFKSGNRPPAGEQSSLEFLCVLVQVGRFNSICGIKIQEKMMRGIILTFVILALSITLSGCFPGGRHYSPQEPAGFFTGIWHGWIAPISLIVGLFKSEVRVYEVANTGWWYDLGFYIAVISGFGSVALSRRGKKHHD